MASPKLGPAQATLAFIFSVFVCYSLTNSFYRLIMADTDWDVYIFTQNWPPSVCLLWEEKSRGNTCLSASGKTSWTIHGIWPTKFGTLGPNYCNTSMPFNPEAIYGIKDELNDKWAPIEKHAKASAFWKHEWEKHGTCASTIPAYPNEFEYFNQGLKWSTQYNLTTVLNKAGITPGRAYNVSAIWSTVKQEFGKNPHIACFTDQYTKSTFVVEIRICFNKALQIVDCDGIKFLTRWDHRRKPQVGSGNFTDCVPNQLVEYPITTAPPPSPPAPQQTTTILEALKLIQFLEWVTS